MSNTRKLRPAPAPRRSPASPTSLAPRTSPGTRSRPGCDCTHGDVPDLHGCERPAYFRVTVVCAVRGCHDAAASYLLCGSCTDNLIEEAEAHPHSPELRITVL